MSCVSTECKSKFQRSLPSAWSQVSLIMRTKNQGVDSLSFDDLYNNLRVFESDVKGSTASSSSPQNVAFVSENTSTLMNCPQLDHEDLEQIDEYDLEEMDLKWQVAMISMRMKKFYKRTSKIQFDAKEPVGFDKTKVECYNCHKTGHFARECRIKGNQDNRRRDAWNSGTKDGSRTGKKEDSKALVTIDGEESYTEREQLSDASIEIKAYTQGLKKVEAQLVAHQQGQLWYEQKIKFMKIDLDDKTNVLTYHKKLLAEAQKEKEDLKAKVEKWHNSSKNLSKLLNTQMSANDKFGLGYGDNRYDGILSYENEVLQSVFMNKESELEKQPLYDRFVIAGGMHVVPPPMTGNYMPSGPEIEVDYSQFTYGPKQTQSSESESQTSEFDTCESNISTEPSELVSEPVVNESNIECQPKVWSDAPIIEEYESDSEDEYVSTPRKEQETPSFANQQVKTPRETIKNQFTHSQKPKVDKTELGYGFTVRACFVCGSLNHLIRDCDFHEKRMARKAELNNGWNNVQRVNKQNQFVPSAVLTRTGKIPVSTARASSTKNFSTARQSVNRQTALTSTAMKVNTVKPIVNRVRPANVFHKTHSPSSRPFKKTTVLRTDFSKQKVNTAKVTTVSTVGGKRETAVKPSAGCNWRPQRYNWHNDYPHRALKNKGIVDSGCSRHMTGNKAYLAEFQDFNGGPVAFGGSKGYITGKGKIKTGKLDFEDVCFFKLPDENQVLLKIPRQNNMYSFNLENIVPSGGLACLIAKATTDESNKWHRRLGHVNFKNLNKLVKGNLVRGLPSKLFQNDHTCVACQKGKQHKASCKAKTVSSISHSLQLLHMDLFGPTSVRSLNHKTYCLVITDDFSRELKADRLLAEKLQEEEREKFTIEERAKFLHDTIAAQRKFLAQQRSEAIRNIPPIKNQLRIQMMTYLKHGYLYINDESRESNKTDTMALELIRFVKKQVAELEPEDPMEMRRIFECWFQNHTTNGHQFTMLNRHKNWLVHKQMAYGKDFSNPFMIQECKIQEVNASNACSRDTNSSGIVSNKGNDQSLENHSNTSGDESSKSRNECNEKSTFGDDTDIRPSYDTKLIIECKIELLRNNSTALGESNRTRDRYFVALHDKEIELAKYKTFKDHTIENDTLERTDIQEKDEKQSQKRQNQARDGKDKVKSKPKPIVSTDGSKVSTDRQIEGTEEQIESTDGQRKGTEDHTEEGSATQATQTPTSTIFGDDETIAKVLLNMSQAKAVSREKEKGVELKDIEETDRPRPTSTRSLLTLKPLPKIDPKDKGKKKIEEEDESESESDGIPEAEKKFKQLESDEEMARKIQEEWEGEEERNRIAEEKATNEALIRNFDDIKARIEADRLLAEKLQEQEREQFTIEERAKFLHDTIAAQRKFLAQQRSEAIRNRPPTKNQLRNQMMTYLKHVGNFKHSELKTKKFEEIQALYEKIKRSDEDFISIGSAEDERLIKRMNEKGIDSSKSEVIKEESKEEVQEESKEEESTRKRKLGTRKKMKSRKRRFIQNTSEDDSEKENDELRLHLTIAPDEEKEVDYEILDRKYPIKEWKTECLGTKPQADKAEHLEEINQNVVIRSNGQKRYFSTLMRVLSIFDREDLNAVYQLVMDRYQDEIPEGFDRVLWGDLMVMFNPDDENEFWNSQQDWNIVSWKLHGSSGVHTLVTEAGLVIHMLVEKKYPLRKKVLVQMLKLKLESEEDSTMALELIRFIKKLLAELEPEDFDGDEEDL
ncbi:ribonuclease H-like domain-containing protein [Tanacetum coccineum]